MGAQRTAIGFLAGLTILFLSRSRFNQHKKFSRLGSNKRVNFSKRKYSINLTIIFFRFLSIQFSSKKKSQKKSDKKKNFLRNESFEIQIFLSLYSKRPQSHKYFRFLIMEVLDNLLLIFSSSDVQPRAVNFFLSSPSSCIARDLVPMEFLTLTSAVNFNNSIIIFSSQLRLSLTLSDGGNYSHHRIVTFFNAMPLQWPTYKGITLLHWKSHLKKWNIELTQLFCLLFSIRYSFSCWTTFIIASSWERPEKN